ncbi:nucleoside-diphosphate-sugar epimerase [Marinilabilia salmonicolor]|jgi:nucleoside-diphosphate-sugar epimerase|uniref:NAD-dependent epimerase/dehydratase family protein n=1 Tax=Marinilabilia salmonicolor TaxID=989 RepID=UPI000D04F0EC|nr:NAD-dependent epimerase/dehydratase family protein [Marinilabilia salmonicolor]PRZ01076.1 nucleoside-diphosphate-sugar epimerase [Marinilabilia salmonicolor]
MSKVLVTGANGMLATNVINRLLETGYKVRGMLRNPDKYQGPRNQNLELVTGDITRPDQIEEILKDCTSVIHVAAITSQSIRTYHKYEEVNVKATRKLLELSISNKIKKFVFVSSANAFGYGTVENPGNEKMPIQLPFSKSLYARSKAEAQKEVFACQDRISVSVVNPTFIIGPYDAKPGSGKIILMGHRKRIIFAPPGGKNFVNATDAANGVVAALEKGANGQAYLLAGENLSFRDFFRKLGDIEQKHPMIITIPPLFLNAAGIIGNIIRLSGINSQLSLTNTKMLCVNNFYTSKKAKEELGVRFDGIDKGIKECLSWFRKSGVIDK